MCCVSCNHIGHEKNLCSGDCHKHSYLCNLIRTKDNASVQDQADLTFQQAKQMNGRSGPPPLIHCLKDADS